MPVKRSPSTFLSALGAAAAGGAAFLLGLAVLIGWHTHDLALLHIYHGFVAMAYNTALGFFLTGLALFLTGLGKGRFALPFACGAVLIGGITLAEYALGRSLGIDELFFKEYTRAGIAHFNRMAFTTALSFMLAGTCVILTILAGKRSCPPGIVALLGATVAGLGTIGLSGYMIGIQASYSWGQFTRMAVHTAVGFMAIGIGLVCLADSLSYRGRSRLPRWLPMPVGVAVLTVTLCLWQALVVENGAVDAAIRRLVIATGRAAPELPAIQGLIPLGALASGCAVAVLVALALYLAQTAQLRAAELESANQELGRQIAERERAEEALREREQRLKLIADSSPALIAYIDPDQRYRFVNQTYTQLFGMPCEQILGRRLEEFLGAEAFEVIREQVAKALSGELATGEATIPFPTIGTRHIQFCYAPDVGTDGTIEGFVVTTTDITARKEAELALLEAQEELESRVEERTAELAVAIKQLREQVAERKRAEVQLITHQREIAEQRAFLRQVIDTAPAYIFVKDTDGRFSLVNQSFADATGLSVDEMIGKHTTDILPPDVAEQLLQNDREVIATGTDCVLHDEKIVTKRGQVRWVQMVKRRLIAPDGTVSVLCIATDITERKNLHAQVIQAEKLAALGELIAGVAHEINNPLTAIIGNAELLEMHPDAQVQEDARTIVSMGHRATRIVRSLLTFARGTGGERRMEWLSGLIHATVEMAAYKLRKTSIVLELRLDETVPEILINANEIQQVILNLINNAEHALRGNPGERKLTISTGSETKNGSRYAVLSVEDNGHGIPDEVIGSIFDPFFTTKGIGEGTGLGLSICHGIAEAHGGHLMVKSEVGKGTIFTLMLPLETTHLSPAKAA